MNRKQYSVHKYSLIFWTTSGGTEEVGSACGAAQAWFPYKP